jgi:hypothetical protein
MPQHALDLLRRVADTARRAGVRVRPSQYVRPDPVLPPAMLMLGRRSTACEEADAVATISARLAAALRAAVTPPSSAQHGAPAARVISERLASRLRGEPSTTPSPASAATQLPPARPPPRRPPTAALPAVKLKAPRVNHRGTPARREAGEALAYHDRQASPPGSAPTDCSPVTRSRRPASRRRRAGAQARLSVCQRRFWCES